jgi:predicted transcriptional regulator
MLNPQNTTQVREFFYNAWMKKANTDDTLSELEVLAIECINLHPEYHIEFNNISCINKQFTSQENPFLHLSMHLAVVEQIKINQPIGIQNLSQKLTQIYGYHESIHVIIDCLQQIMLSQNMYASMDELNRLYLHNINLRLSIF